MGLHVRAQLSMQLRKAFNRVLLNEEQSPSRNGNTLYSQINKFSNAILSSFYASRANVNEKRQVGSK